jgi:hypothetical protein
MHEQELLGTVTFDSKAFPALLMFRDGRIELRITRPFDTANFGQPKDIEIAHFKSHTKYFTLFQLLNTNQSISFGIGHQDIYSVTLAFDGILFDHANEIKAKTWTIYIEDFAKIIHVTGLKQSYGLSDPTDIIFSFVHRRANSILLNCPFAKLGFEISQDMRSGGNPIDGPSLSYKYPLFMHSDTELEKNEALDLLNRARLFFSFIMGRVLNNEQTFMKFQDGKGKHTAEVFGLEKTQKSDNPDSPIIMLEVPIEFEKVLNCWFEKFDVISEAIYLYFNALERTGLMLSLRFQLLIQAFEAMHRSIDAVEYSKIDSTLVVAALTEKKIEKDIIERIKDYLKYAHEPSLRSRLKQTLKELSLQISCVGPSLKEDIFTQRIVATRNQFVHGLKADKDTLKGVDLWNYTERLKAIVCFMIAKELGIETSEFAKNLEQKGFINFLSEA